MLRRLFSLSFLKPDFDLALLLLRAGTGANLFLKHGWEKIVYFRMMGHNFFDPLGIGHYTTFLMAFTTDVIFSVLIALGVATRWCCAFYFGLVFGAWWLRHHFLYWNPAPGAPNHLAGSHGELVVVYLLLFIVMFVAGPGRYSVDAMLSRRQAAAPVLTAA